GRTMSWAPVAAARSSIRRQVARFTSASVPASNWTAATRTTGNLLVSPSETLFPESTLGRHYFNRGNANVDPRRGHEVHRPGGQRRGEGPAGVAGRRRARDQVVAGRPRRR